MAITSPKIRVAGPADAPTIVRFCRALAMETEDKELPLSVVEQGVARALVDPSRAAYYLAEIDGEVVGQTMITLEWSDWRSGFFWWIQSVYVDPDFRGRGVFRTLHEHIRQEAQSRDEVCGLRLYVHAENKSAMRTYDSLGMHRAPYLIFEEPWDSSAS